MSGVYMVQSVTSVSACEIGIASGIIGAGVGYIMAPTKYNLSELLTQEPDVFEKAVAKSALVKQAEAKKDSYRSIVNARNSYRAALKDNKGAAKLAELLSSSNLDSAYKNIREFIPKARAQYALGLGLITALAGIVIRYVSKPRS